MVAALSTNRKDTNSQEATLSPEKSLLGSDQGLSTITPTDVNPRDIRSRIQAGTQATTSTKADPSVVPTSERNATQEESPIQRNRQSSEQAPAASTLTESERLQATMIINEARALARDEGMNFQRRATGLQPEAVNSLAERLRAKGVELSTERLKSDPQLAQALLESQLSGFDEGRSLWTKAHDISAKLYNAMQGWGTDEAAIFRALEGKTPDEITAIRGAFKANYRADLDKWLKSELGGSDLLRAQTLMQGDPKLGAAAELYWAMKGSGTDEVAINRILSRPDAAEVEKIFNERFAKQYGTSDLKAALQVELGGDDLTQARNLLASNDPNASQESRDAAKIRADAAELHKAMKGGVTGAGTDEPMVHAVLDRNVGRGSLDQLKQEYQRLYNSELRTHLKGELSFNDEKRALSLLHGDKVAADAIALKSAEWGWGVDRDQVRAVLENSSDTHRQAVLSKYRDMEGGRDFVESARSQVSTDAVTVIDAFARNGKLSAAQELLDSMTGTGTNEDRLLSHVAGKSKSELEQIRHEYKQMTARELDKDVNGEVSGDVQFDMTEALRGRPESLDEFHGAIERRYNWERSGINLLSDIWTDQGKVLDRQIEATRRHVANVKNGTASSEDVEILRAQYDVQKVHAEAFRAAKDAITYNAATVVTTAVAVGSVIATGGTALGFWATVGIAAASSAAARIGTKVALKGSRYNWAAELPTDVGISVIESATVKAGAVVTKFLGTTAPVQRLAATGVVGRTSAAAIEGAVDGTGSGFIVGAGEAVLTTDFSEMSAGQIASNITTRGGIAALGGGLGGSVLSGGLTIPMEKLAGKRAAGEVAQEVASDGKLSTTAQRLDGEEAAIGTAGKPNLAEVHSDPGLEMHESGPIELVASKPTAGEAIYETITGEMSSKAQGRAGRGRDDPADSRSGASAEIEHRTSDGQKNGPRSTQVEAVHNPDATARKNTATERRVNTSQDTQARTVLEVDPVTGARNATQEFSSETSAKNARITAEEDLHTKENLINPGKIDPNTGSAPMQIAEYQARRAFKEAVAQQAALAQTSPSASVAKQGHIQNIKDMNAAIRSGDYDAALRMATEAGYVDKKYLDQYTGDYVHNINPQNSKLRQTSFSTDQDQAVTNFEADPTTEAGKATDEFRPGQGAKSQSNEVDKSVFVSDPVFNRSDAAQQSSAHAWDIGENRRYIRFKSNAKAEEAATTVRLAEEPIIGSNGRKEVLLDIMGGPSSSFKDSYNIDLRFDPSLGKAGSSGDALVELSKIPDRSLDTVVVNNPRTEDMETTKQIVDTLAQKLKPGGRIIVSGQTMRNQEANLSNYLTTLAGDGGLDVIQYGTRKAPELHPRIKELVQRGELDFQTTDGYPIKAGLGSFVIVRRSEE